MDSYERPRILLVDDEAIIALEQTHRLSKAGFAVDAVYSAEKAFKRLEGAEAPDVVLMDINLGRGMDGIEAARIIRERWALPVVFFSNSTDRTTVERARSVSPYGYVRKLADEFALLQTIRTAIELSARHEYPFRSATCPHALKDELYDLLRADTSIFEFLEQTSLDGVWYIDIADPANAWLSPRFWITLGMNPREHDGERVDWSSLMLEEDIPRSREAAHAHLENPEVPFDEVLRYRHADGSVVWVRCRGRAIRDDAGTPIRMLGVHTEITKQMRAQEEQEHLLREMNHRVKNNLTILQAMIAIEESQPDKPKTASLADIESRLRAISVIHDRLTVSQRYTDVSIAEYIHELAAYYERIVRDDDHPLEFALDIDEILLSTSAASRMGMVVSELLSNTIRHSRASVGSVCTVFITVRSEDDRLKLSYTDGGDAADGVTSIDDLPHGTGLTLVESLARQIGGRLELANLRPMVFELILPLDAVRVEHREVVRQGA
ncbi:MAG: sensor histidine kinase [Spirochaetota bacterium]